MLVFAFIGCAEPHRTVGSAPAPLPVSDDVPTVPPSADDEIVVLVAGGLHVCAVWDATDAIELHNGHDQALVIRDGERQPAYFDPVGVDAFVIDELIEVGYRPDQITLVVRCSVDASLREVAEQQIPALSADLDAYDLPSPIGVVLWQGEHEAAQKYLLNDGAFGYEERLVGASGSVRTALEQWSGLRWSVIELAARRPSAVDPQSAALVRSAQHAAAAYYLPTDAERICTIQSYGSIFLPHTQELGDNPRVDLSSMEMIARRSVYGLVAPYCP